MSRIPAVFAVAVTLAFGSEARASTITLVGVTGSGFTATVSNYSLIGDVFSFVLTNTSASGYITNIGLAAGDIVAATGYATTAPFTYMLFNDGTAPPEAPFLKAGDFGLFPSSQATGITPGQGFVYSFTGLTLDDGSPLSGVSADELAGGLVVRVRGLSTPNGTDIAAAVPEPASLLLLGVGVGVGMARRRLGRQAGWMSSLRSER
jgi:hypothetical protein